MLCSIGFIRWPYAFLNYFTSGWPPADPCKIFDPINVLHSGLGSFLPIFGGHRAFLRNLTSGWPWLTLHDIWPQQCITLWSWVLPTKFGGHRALLSKLTPHWLDPSWPLHDLRPQQCITFWSGVLSTKFGGHRALLSKLTPTWPQLTPTWPLTQ